MFVKDNLAVIGTVLVDAFDVNDDDITPKFVDVADTVDEPIAKSGEVLLGESEA